MKYNKLKRFLSGFMASFLCVAMNINPIGVICTEVANSEFVEKLGIIGDNIQYVLSDASEPVSMKEVKAEEGGITVNVDCNHTCEHSHTDVVEAVNNNTNSNAQHIDASAVNIVSAIDTVNQSINHWGGTINDTIIKKANEIMKNDDKNTQIIKETIEQAQHRYKVAYLYSVNNMNDEVLWRPTLSELPNAEVIPYATTGYASVYSGFWDAGIDNKMNNGLSQTSFGIQTIQHSSSDAQRAIEILGYDSIIKAEGYYGTTGGNEGTYENILIEEGDVTWGDAIQVLYKALGEEEYTYSYFTTANPGITPENSPLSQNLSNVTQFDTSEGAYYLFVSRSDQLVGSGLKEVNPIYWHKAQMDGLVYKDDYDKPITWKDFVILASRIMELYGEPVLTETERNALLQVYGAEYPLQLGAEIADAWSYLKARGVLSYDNISYASAVGRDELLDVCMRIKDPNSRLDYKNIQLTMDLEDAMVADGYYPVNNLKYSAHGFAAESEINYAFVDYFDYFVLNSSTQVGMVNDSTGSHPIAPNFITATGARVTDLAVTDATGMQIEGASFEGIFKDSDNNSYYHFQVPKSYRGLIRLDSSNETDFPKYIDIDAANGGGGIYTAFTIDNFASGNEGDSTVDSTGLMIANSTGKTFEMMKNKEEWLKYVDYKRAGEPDPTSVALLPNSSLTEKLAYVWNKWTTPMEVKAAEVVWDESGNRYKITIDKTKGTTGGNGKTSDEDYMGFGSSATNSISRLLNSTATLLHDEKWTTLMEDCGSEEKFKEVCQSIYNYYTAKNATSDRKSLLVNTPNCNTYECIMSNGVTEYIGAANVNYESHVEFFTNGVNDGSIMMGSTLFGMISGDASIFNGLIEPGNSKSDISMEGDDSSFPLYLNDSNDYIFKLKGSAPLPDTENIIAKGLEWWKDQAVYIYQLKTNGDLDATDISLNIKANLERNSGQTSKLTVDQATYSIATNENDVVQSVFGQVACLSPDGDSQTQQTSNSQDIFNDELNASVATSSLLNSMDKENILIAWDDLVGCGIVKDTFGGRQPMPNETSGIYYLQTQQGVVKVNQNNYAVLVGTTYYNLRNSDGTGPRLVYTDQDGKVYFDYRCIIGIAQNSISATGTTVTEADNCIGTGTSVIYTLNGTGATSNVMNTKEISSYNWPNMPLNQDSADPGVFNTVGIIQTKFDTQSFKALGTGTETEYWGGYTGDRIRMSLASFSPTANWLTVIKSDASAGSRKAGLFVWYPRGAFEGSDNWYSLDGSQDIKTKYPYVEIGCPYPELAEQLGTILKTSVTVDNEDAPDAAYDIMDESKWWNAMTYDAYCNLYELAGEVGILSKDWVLRYFDLTDASAVDCTNKYTMESMNGTNVASVYWLEYIGFVYNVPNLDEFNMEDYLNGKIPLPIVFNYKGTISHANFLYINPNYYAGGLKESGNSTVHKGYGYEIGSNGIYDVRHINSDNLGLVSDKEMTLPTDGSSDWNPIGDSAVQWAPVGTYILFGDNASNTDLQKHTSEEFNEFALTSSFVFMGGSRLYYCDNTSGTTDKQFFIGCKHTAPVEFKEGDKNLNPVFYTVYDTNLYQVLVSFGTNYTLVARPDYKDTDISSLQNTDIGNLLDGIELKYILNRLDEFSSWVVLFVFYVCPYIAFILVTILVGLAFLANNKIVKKIFNEVFDPIKFITLGNRNVNNVTWRNCIIPCFICYIAIALFINGNIIKLTAWVVNFAQVVKEVVLQFL